MKLFGQALLFGITGIIVGMLISQFWIRPCSQADRVFLEEMIPHHQEAIEMAKIEVEKGNSPDLKRLANNIIKAQEEEIKEMQKWYFDWYGIEYKTKPESMPELNQLNKLSGNDLDSEFATQMIMHHKSAISMSMIIKNVTRHKEIRNLSKNINTSQEKEVKELRDFLGP